MPSHPQIREALYGMSKAKTVVALVPSERCLKLQLGGELPVVIEGGEAWEDVAEEVDDCVIGDAEIWRRPADGSQPNDPRAVGNPYVTEDGENILDIKWYENGLAVDGEPAEYQDVFNLIRAVPGVTAIGLSVSRADAAVVPSSQGLRVMRRAASE